MVTVTDHPGSETIQKLLEEDRCARGKEEFQSAWHEMLVPS